MSDYHGRIMNIPVNPLTIEHSPGRDKRLYKLGHRDARHAAAEIMLRVDELLEEHRRFHDKVGCPGIGNCRVCELEAANE